MKKNNSVQRENRRGSESVIGLKNIQKKRPLMLRPVFDISIMLNNISQRLFRVSKN